MYMLHTILSLAACTGTPDEIALLDTQEAAEYGREPIQPLELPKDLDQARVTLGGALFHDVRLSVDDSLSCASCHSIPDGGDDGRPTSIGVGGTIGPINAPTVLNSSLNLSQFWDGRAATLEDQVDGPVTHPGEMGSTWAEVIDKLSADAQTRARFDAVFEDGVTQQNIAAAIAEYERSLITIDSPFDRWLRGDPSALSGEAIEGYQLFKDLGCASCHQGRNAGGNMYQRFGVMGDYFADRGDPTEADVGRFAVTGLEQDRHKFRVPSLRNVALTAPYFHDGTAVTLRDAVSTMGLYQLGRRLSEEEIDKLEAFLESLTGQLPSVERYQP